MDNVHVQQVIICTKSRRGNGTLAPVRVVKEVFELDGTPIAENDPLSFTFEVLLDFINYRFKGSEKEKVIEWAMDYFIENETK